MSKNNGWIPLDENLKSYLPKDRPYSAVEALFCHQLDMKNNVPFSIRGYAKLWQWSRKKVTTFIDKVREPQGSHKGATREPPVHLIILDLEKQWSHKGATREPQGSRTIRDKIKIKNIKNKDKDMFRTTEKNVVLEPLNGKLFSDYDWGKDVIEVIGKFPTLALAVNDNSRNAEFWDGHVDIMSNYFPTDEEMKRWFYKVMFDINTWQSDNPHRASQTEKGLRQRISRWLSKEYQKLEVTKR